MRTPMLLRAAVCDIDLDIEMTQLQILMDAVDNILSHLHNIRTLSKHCKIYLAIPRLSQACIGHYYLHMQK